MSFTQNKLLFLCYASNEGEIYCYASEIQENLLLCERIYCYAGDAGEKILCVRKFSNARDSRLLHA